MNISSVVSDCRFQLRMKASQDDAIQLEQLGYVVQYKENTNIIYVDIKIESHKNAHYTLDEVIQDLIKKSVATFNIKPAAQILAYEWGGYDNDTVHGHAQIVCGRSGKALQPFFVGDVPNRKHAAFSVPVNVCICTAERHTDGRIKLNVFDLRFQIYDDLQTVELLARPYWSGSRFNEANYKFRIPLGIAFAKAMLPGCAGPCYIAGSEDDQQQQDEQA